MPRSDDICVALQRPDLDRLISGALKNTIDAHGPITIGSATKRITSQLKGRAREQRKANGIREFIGEAITAHKRLHQRAKEPLPRCKTCGALGPYYCTLGDRCENKLRMEGKEY